MFTYVLKDHLSGLTKIGKTKDLEKRLSTMSTSNLNISYILAEELDIERELQLLFKDKKIKKEWFDLSLDDINGIKEIFNKKIIEKWY